MSDLGDDPDLPRTSVKLEPLAPRPEPDVERIVRRIAFVLRARARREPEGDGSRELSPDTSEDAGFLRAAQVVSRVEWRDGGRRRVLWRP